MSIIPVKFKRSTIFTGTVENEDDKCRLGTYGIFMLKY